MRRWEQAKAGEGQVVLISGEPGIGKSRLARPWWSGLPASRTPGCASSARRTIRTAPSIRSSPTSNAPPASAATTRPSSGSTSSKRCWRRRPTISARLRRCSPTCSSVPTGERYPPLNLTPQKRKEKTLTALTAQVEGLSAREPVLMVYEECTGATPPRASCSTSLLIGCPRFAYW